MLDKKNIWVLFLVSRIFPISLRSLREGRKKVLLFQFLLLLSDFAQEEKKEPWPEGE